jgi:flagellar hook protein FlgE
MSRKVYQVPLATFQNADGLSAITGGAYQASTDSGTATIDAPNSGGAGTVQSGALEASTVDLATEFTNLITTQRAYSAAARIVTTADTMLQTLEQLPST